MLGKVFQRFVEQSPVAVMVGSVLERVLKPELLDELFDGTAERQYPRERLFSTVFDLMSPVGCGQSPSLPAAYPASLHEIGGSLTAVDHNLNGLAPALPAALVRSTAQELAPVMTALKGERTRAGRAIGPRLWLASVWRRPTLDSKHSARPRPGRCPGKRGSYWLQPGACF
jgi:hypothetical protein